MELRASLLLCMSVCACVESVTDGGCVGRRSAVLATSREAVRGAEAESERKDAYTARHVVQSAHTHELTVEQMHCATLLHAGVNGR
eukprot:1340405-Pleurochrysis_carterae.AAC.1